VYIFVWGGTLFSTHHLVTHWLLCQTTCCIDVEGFVSGKIWAIARVGDTSDVRKVEKQRLDTLLLDEARAKYSEIAGCWAANELKDAHQHQNRGLGVTKAQYIEATVDCMENSGVFDTRRRSHNSHAEGGTAPDPPPPDGVWSKHWSEQWSRARACLLTCGHYAVPRPAPCSRLVCRCCKSGQSFSHSKLGPDNEFTCKTRFLRFNLCTVGTSRWREHLAKSSITFHTGYRSAAPFLNVAFAPVRATDTFAELLETPRLYGAPKAPSPCPLPATSASVTKSVTVVEWGGVHVFNASALSRMFLTIACNSHPSCSLLQAAASFTLRCMFSMICALTFCMSPYMSGVDHTCAAIPCALGKVNWRRVGFEMSSLPELSFSLSRECCFSTCATHCFRDVLQTGNVYCRHCSTATPSSWFAKIILQVMLGLWTLLYHVRSLPHATIIAGIGSLTASGHGVSCKRAVLCLRISWSKRCGNTQHKVMNKASISSAVILLNVYAGELVSLLDWYCHPSHARFDWLKLLLLLFLI